ncbi:hypothetical protein MMC21_003085 [Puttea exsequens]|nr:hypothetical protein [Puttea exsequens]
MGSKSRPVPDYSSSSGFSSPSLRSARTPLLSESESELADDLQRAPDSDISALPAESLHKAISALESDEFADGGAEEETLCKDSTERGMRMSEDLDGRKEQIFKSKQRAETTARLRSKEAANQESQPTKSASQREQQPISTKPSHSNSHSENLLFVPILTIPPITPHLPARGAAALHVPHHSSTSLSTTHHLSSFEDLDIASIPASDRPTTTASAPRISISPRPKRDLYKPWSTLLRTGQGTLLSSRRSLATMMTVLEPTAAEERREPLFPEEEHTSKRAARRENLFAHCAVWPNMPARVKTGWAEMGKCARNLIAVKEAMRGYVGRGRWKTTQMFSRWMNGKKR